MSRYVSIYERRPFKKAHAKLDAVATRYFRAAVSTLVTGGVLGVAAMAFGLWARVPWLTHAPLVLGLGGIAIGHLAFMRRCSRTHRRIHRLIDHASRIAMAQIEAGRHRGERAGLAVIAGGVTDERYLRELGDRLGQTPRGRGWVQ